MSSIKVLTLIAKRVERIDLDRREESSTALPEDFGQESALVTSTKKLMKLMKGKVFDLRERHHKVGFLQLGNMYFGLPH